MRRLVTILAADVVGYSRLMEANEEGTLLTLGTYRKAIGAVISGHEGRIFGGAGDSIVAEFGSAIEAVQCAVAIQYELRTRNADLAEDRRMLFRIGVNLGDVVVDGDDLFGDGVNVAARLEAMAEPGGVQISSSVFEQVKNKLPIIFEDMGTKKVNNMSEPVHGYRVPIEAAANIIQDKRQIDVTATRPTIAVLPFVNMSRDEDQEYFADGLTEDITTALSSWRSFPVISRHSSFSYKGRVAEVQRVMRELGARYVLEGSVRKAGARVRITVQLSDAVANQQVWAEKYDRELQDIFDLQDEISQRIAASLEPELKRAEHRRSITKKPKDLAAWDHYQRGMHYMYQFSCQGNAQARKMFERAVELDPAYSDAYSGLALSHHRDIFWGYVASEEPSLTRLREAALKAVICDNRSSHGHLVLGFACLWAGEYEQAIEAEQKALELNPSNAFARVSLGNVFDLAGDPELGIEEIRQGLQLNPKDPRNHIFVTNLARGYLNARRYDEAVEWARKAVHRPPHPLKYMVLASSLGHLGRLEEACVAFAMCERVQPGFVERWARRRVYKRHADNQHVLDGLAKARCREGVMGPTRLEATA